MLDAGAVGLVADLPAVREAEVLRGLKVGVARVRAQERVVTLPLQRVQAHLGYLVAEPGIT